MLDGYVIHLIHSITATLAKRMEVTRLARAPRQRHILGCIIFQFLFGRYIVAFSYQFCEFRVATYHQLHLPPLALSAVQHRQALPSTISQRRKISVPLCLGASVSAPSSVHDPPQRQVRSSNSTRREWKTLLRVGIPSILAGLCAYLVFPYLAMTLAASVQSAGALTVLSTDSSQFVQNFLSVSSLLFSILVGQTCKFPWCHQFSFPTHHPNHSLLTDNVTIRLFLVHAAGVDLLRTIPRSDRGQVIAGAGSVGMSRSVDVSTMLTIDGQLCPE